MRAANERRTLFPLRQSQVESVARGGLLTPSPGSFTSDAISSWNVLLGSFPMVLFLSGVRVGESSRMPCPHAARWLQCWSSSPDQRALNGRGLRQRTPQMKPWTPCGLCRRVPEMHTAEPSTVVEL